jgi:hypothetical protein
MRRLFFRGPRRSSRWLRVTAYYLSVLLVFSFICFEVLDLDGSDFPVPSKSPRIKLAESQDMRRGMLVNMNPWAKPILASLDDRTSEPKPRDFDLPKAVQVAPFHRCPLTLPRAALSDSTA